MFNRNQPSEEQLGKGLQDLILKTVKVIRRFKPRHQHRDLIWKFHLQVNKRWYLFGAREDREFYVLFCSKFETLLYDHVNKKLLEADPAFDYEAFLPKIIAALELLAKDLKSDPIQTGKALMKRISPQMREGVIHRSYVRKLLPDWLRYDKELGAANVQAMVNLIEDYSRPQELESMTAEKYFSYCKVAYLANNGVKHSVNVKESQTGREMYAQWADNRDGGLKEIDQRSEQAFVDWLEGGGRAGSHPWEIYRGGNTTHIDLYVERYIKGWRISLSAYSSTRLAETCRIALALYKAGLPFHLNHEDSYLKRLLCDDFVGIVPEHDSPHRGWQRFPTEFTIADVIQFSWFKDERTGKWVRKPSDIAPLIYWLPCEPAVLNR